MTRILTALIMIFSVQSFAAEQNSACSILVKKNAAVEGTNVEAKYEVASVSKVMTSQWAIHTLTADYRFKTQIQVLPVSSDTVDVHLVGGGDPYFNAWQFQYMVGELNKRKITKIRTLSFDENFKFKIENRDFNTSAKIDWKPGEPSPAFIKSQLEKMSKQLYYNYASLRNRVKTAENMSLPAKISLSIKEVKYVPSSEYGGTSQAKSFVMESLPLHELLKEMNRNSNNYAANILFENLGGAVAYEKYTKDVLKLGKKSIDFINGSGDSLVGENGQATYNRASCAAILAVVAHLYVDLRNQGKTIMDVLAVAGNNSPIGETSTLGSYANEATRNSVAAKTGSVCPAITLGGLIHSKDGIVFFAYMYRTKWCNHADWTNARSKINTSLVRLIADHGGPVRETYHTPIYSQIDAGSAFQDVTEIQMR